MRPAIDFDDVARHVQVVIDGVRIADEIALVAGEHSVDRIARMLGRVLEEHVAPRRDEHPEVTDAALLWMLHQHARRIGAQVRLLEGIAPHRGNEWSGELGELRVPTAHRRARQRQALAPVYALESMQRLMILPALDDRVREHARPGKAFGDRQLDGRGDVHLGRGVALALFGHELRPNDPYDHK
jgi:hypothetical protein